MDQTIGPANEVDLRVARGMDIVKRNMLWSAGAGAVPVPLLELAAIAGVQVKLVKELAELYGLPFRQDLAKTAVLALIGGIGSMTLGSIIAFSSLRAIPVLGQMVALLAVPGMAAAITYAIGKVFIAHFEAGGTLLDFDAKRTREYFRAQYEEGTRHASVKPTPADADADAAAAGTRKTAASI